jgi:uncharacterized protein YjbI with pentapeptide repeats
VGRKKHSFKQEPSSKNSPWWKRLWGWTEFGKKSGWEYLELLSTLAIPIVLAAAGFWFTAQQDQRQERIEAQRAKSERTTAEQRAQDEALQAYLDQMSTLMLGKDLSDEKVRTLLRARTLTVLAGMDPSRKTQIMRFLIEAELVQSRDEEDPVISLEDADLSGANLPYGADLIGTNLSGATLSGAILGAADLRRTYLSEANLSEANLSDANLTGANLTGADLVEADLGAADLSDADLSFATLSEANLEGANLEGANLRWAALWIADLSDAILSDADLSGATLSGATLSDANLNGALGVTDDQLAPVQSLEGATMPNGQKYGEWVQE